MKQPNTRISPRRLLLFFAILQLQGFCFCQLGSDGFPIKLEETPPGFGFHDGLKLAPDMEEEQYDPLPKLSSLQEDMRAPPTLQDSPASSFLDRRSDPRSQFGSQGEGIEDMSSFFKQRDSSPGSFSMPDNDFTPSGLAPDPEPAVGGGQCYFFTIPPHDYLGKMKGIPADDSSLAKETTSRSKKDAAAFQKRGGNERRANQSFESVPAGKRKTKDASRDRETKKTSLDDLDFLTSALPEDVPAEQEKQAQAGEQSSWWSNLFGSSSASSSSASSKTEVKDRKAGKQESQRPAAEKPKAEGQERKGKEQEATNEVKKSQQMSDDAIAEMYKRQETGRGAAGKEAEISQEERFCKEIAGPYAMFDKKEGACRCQDGYEEDERGKCVRQKKADKRMKEGGKASAGVPAGGPAPGAGGKGGGDPLEFPVRSGRKKQATGIAEEEEEEEELLTGCTAEEETLVKSEAPSDLYLNFDTQTSRDPTLQHSRRPEEGKSSGERKRRPRPPNQESVAPPKSGRKRIPAPPPLGNQSGKRSQALLPPANEDFGQLVTRYGSAVMGRITKVFLRARSAAGKVLRLGWQWVAVWKMRMGNFVRGIEMKNELIVHQGSAKVSDELYWDVDGRDAESVERYWRQKGRAEAEECMKMHAKTQSLKNAVTALNSTLLEAQILENCSKTQKELIYTREEKEKVELALQEARESKVKVNSKLLEVVDEKVELERMYEQQVLLSYDLKKNIAELEGLVKSLQERQQEDKKAASQEEEQSKRAVDDQDAKLLEDLRRKEEEISELKNEIKSMQEQLSKQLSTAQPQKTEEQQQDSSSFCCSQTCNAEC
ncbi:hypothetical protein GUITHDRAFT_146086 [Guillardia theta CCMP2712]|uniref:Uncharacterized protein n=1 Tax=Guillardia theta (strain CCMP2712) TaxID=905079 RepID=L1IIX0_GUITC|nr:hypothetical protein GUITHDRAFT_146086 [Guillardia theta CCMP2712]EKX36047.1 hypothetical protein GUITHDRAFT_146086 [Guillardia theta CCMP2712]|eukprot:XP_005823027.1 hypothetical protein GUITHDRAFT_146086 [Guillardia theta CCMP2712]